MGSPFCDMLDRQAREQGARTAIVSEAERRSVTFTELAQRVGALPLDGVKPGDFVALATGNGVAFIEHLFALRARGAAVLTIDAKQSPREVATRLGARWLVTRDEGLVRVGDGRALPAGTAFVKLTSGSTVAPRGALFTEEALVGGIEHIREGMSLTREDVVLVAIPLSHSYGFDNGPLSLAAIGTPLVIQMDVLPGAVRASIERHGVTFWPAVPALLRAVSGPLAPSLRRVISASAPLSRGTADAFAAATGVRVQEFFGATEAGGIAFETRPDDPASEGTVGFPMPGVRIELADGCVRVHSEANRFALLTEAGVETSPPYVETGDRACLTPEGRLKLLGRTVHVANVGGVKVDLAAIETFFRGVAGVSDAAAMALEDPARGQRVVVAVESQSRTAEELKALINGDLAPHEVPRDIRVLARLPRTERGKLDRAALEGLIRA